jgi:hypothetical protein
MDKVNLVDLKRDLVTEDSDFKYLIFSEDDAGNVNENPLYYYKISRLKGISDVDTIYKCIPYNKVTKVKAITVSPPLYIKYDIEKGSFGQQNLNSKKQITYSLFRYTESDESEHLKSAYDRDSELTISSSHSTTSSFHNTPSIKPAVLAKPLTENLTFEEIQQKLHLGEPFDCVFYDRHFHYANGKVIEYDFDDTADTAINPRELQQGTPLQLFEIVEKQNTQLPDDALFVYIYIRMEETSFFVMEYKMCSKPILIYGK